MHFHTARFLCSAVLTAATVHGQASLSNSDIPPQYIISRSTSIPAAPRASNNGESTSPSFTTSTRVASSVVPGSRPPLLPSSSRSSASQVTTPPAALNCRYDIASTGTGTSSIRACFARLRANFKYMVVNYIRIGSSYAYKCSSILSGIFFNASNPCGLPLAQFAEFASHIVTVQVTQPLYSITRLCDGIPREFGNATTTTTEIYATLDQTASWNEFFLPALASAIKAKPELLPYLYPCQIPARDCRVLWSSFARNTQTWVTQFQAGTLPAAPVCNTDENIPGHCTIRGGQVQLLYFPPVTTSSRDICATTTFNPFATTALPANAGGGVGYAIYRGRTLFANSAYISFATLYAWDGFNQQTIGRPRPGDIVAIESSQLSSLRYPYGLNENVHPFNFGDLEEPVPWSAFSGQAECFFGCPTIRKDNYFPQLAIPTQVRGLDPAWANCDLDWDGVPDPPYVLQTVAQLVLPPITTPAPGPTPVSPPLQTPLPVVELTPSPAPNQPPPDPNPVQSPGGGSQNPPAQGNQNPPAQGTQNPPAQGNPSPQTTSGQPSATVAPAANNNPNGAPPAASAPPGAAPLPATTIAVPGQTLVVISQLPAGIVVGSSITLVAGGPGTTIGGQRATAVGSSVVVIGSSTITLSAQPTIAGGGSGSRTTSTTSTTASLSLFTGSGAAKVGPIWSVLMAAALGLVAMIAL